MPISCMMDVKQTHRLESTASFAWRPVRAKIVAATCAILIVVPLLNDLFKPGVNLAILFVLPLLICAWLGEKKFLRPILLLCVLFTYMGLLIRIGVYGYSAWPWGLLNRTMVVVSLIIVTYVLEIILSYLKTNSFWKFDRRDVEQKIFEEILFSAQRFAAIVSAVLLSAGIFIVDLVTPGQLNFPILYAVPLLLIVWTRSHLWLWLITCLLVLLAMVGWFAGDAPTSSSTALHTLATNRFIAVAVMVVLAVIINLATSPASTSPHDPNGD